MNKHLYRIIFNRARGMLIVVADIAGCGRASDGPASGTGHTLRRLISKLSPIHFALLLAIGAIYPARAAIVADASAPGKQRPTILNSANGTPQVNIQTPGAGGVSRNVYSRFDVAKQGVILNNSHKNVQSQLGGMVTANPWLARGGAKVILNEVNARDPSKLNGFIEVAGQKAQVVIANPAGITCNGCGFINANRATLTTGQAQINNGLITGYNVSRGEIVVQGSGLDSSRQDHTDIIARSVKINAGIWASDLNVTTGVNHVSADTRKVINQVEQFLMRYEHLAGLQVPNDKKVALYIHISCLIERLIRQAAIQVYSGSREQCQRAHLDDLCEAFSVIENSYSVKIPQAELFYIHDILHRQTEFLQYDQQF